MLINKAKKLHYSSKMVIDILAVFFFFLFSFNRVFNRAHFTVIMSWLPLPVTLITGLTLID